MYTISPLYQIINLNVSTWYLKPLNIKWDQILNSNGWVLSIFDPKLG